VLAQFLLQVLAHFLLQAPALSHHRIKADHPETSALNQKKKMMTVKMMTEAVEAS